MRITAPSHWLLEGLDGVYDVRSDPGPGIRVILAGGGPKIDAATIDACPDLGLIACCSVGYDNIDVAHARSRGVAVTNTPDVLTDDVADLAIALMLGAGRRIARHDAYVRAGEWARKGPPPLTRRMSGRRVGILGLGRIGHAIADRLVPFGSEIAYFSRSPKTDAPWRHEPDPVALARWAEVLIVSVAGGQGTAGLVSAEVIDALGPEGILVNIARGSVVDEAALVDALVSGRLGGAGLDVFAQEPHVPEALFGLDTVVLQPHQGSATVETRAAMARLTLDNVAAFFAGRPLLTPV
jgi:lactate dehydrogenase-like 2-hydroxyacid dehydrogenase